MTEGEGRTCYSSAGFRSRYRPFGATNPKLAPRTLLKCCVSVHWRSPVRFSDLTLTGDWKKVSFFKKIILSLEGPDSIIWVSKN